MSNIIRGDYARRHIKRYGQEITLTNADVSFDAASDWGDESVTSTTRTVRGFVQASRRSPDIRRDPAESSVEIDLEVLIDEQIEQAPDAFEIRDEGTSTRPTEVTVDGITYIVVRPERQRNGIVKLHVRRKG